TTKAAPQEEVWDDPLLAEIRPAVREAIEEVLEQELIRTLGARWYGRAESRVGHRNGSVVRDIGTPMGSTVVRIG
ncbi:MAG: transposase, partial [Acidobacteria bacterium]|nr:transposase [Acidobacteriota bacterium]